MRRRDNDREQDARRRPNYEPPRQPLRHTLWNTDRLPLMMPMQPDFECTSDMDEDMEP